MSPARRITPVILSGGTGVRLWPLSRLGRPKQLISLSEGATMLQQTALRVRDSARFEAPLVVAGEEHAGTILAQMEEAGASPSALILEPAGRGTAPAVALAALEAGEEALLLVMPSDHAISDEAAFLAAVEAGRPAAEEGWLVTFGARPERAETGYGYVKRGEALDGGAYRAAAFAEKPERETAERYVREGGWLWNSGLFLFRAGAFLEALASHAPDVLAAARTASANLRRDGPFARPERAAFEAAPATSIDRGLLEKSDRVAVVPALMGWSDIGSWEAVHALGPLDEVGNLLTGDVVAPGSTGCLIRSDGPTIVALGVEDLVIVATERAVLVVPRGETQRVQEALDALEARRQKPN